MQSWRLRLMAEEDALALRGEHVDHLANTEAKPVMPSSSARAQSSERELREAGNTDGQGSPGRDPETPRRQETIDE